MQVPLRKGTTVLGDVVITIDTDDQVLLTAGDLTPLLAPDLPETAIAALSGFGPAPVPLALYSDIEGLGLSFDRLSMELTVNLAADKSKPQPLSFDHETYLPTLMEPASVNAFLNYTISYTHDWAFAEASGITVDLETAMRVGGVVLEAEGSLGDPQSGFFCPIEAHCREQDGNPFRRRGTRLIYDSPDTDTRTVVGDTSYWGLPTQRTMDLLGFNIEHDPQTFGNHRNQTSRSFNELLVIPRSADLELLINGIPMQRLKLQPGTYSLQDLPITLGANAIEAIVTYDNGEREVFSFSALANQQLLDAGAMTWGVSGGMPATWRDGEREYIDIFQGGGNLRYGFSDTFTGYLTSQTDSTVHNAGGGFYHLTSLGTFHIGGTFSTGAGVGYAATFAYESLPDLSNPHRHLRLAADYTSADFHFPGNAQLLLSDILYPAHDTWLRLSAVASHPLAWDAYASITGRYDFAADDPNLPGAVSPGVDRWSIDLGVTRQFFDSTTVSLTAGYGNDRLLSFSDLEEDPELRFGINVYAQFDNTSVGARHSFGNDISGINASHIVTTPSSTWQASVFTENAPERGLSSTATAGSLSAWGDTRITQTYQQPDSRDQYQRTQIQHGGAIAFADGAFAVGAPIRDAFAIVRPHDNIPDATVIVGNPDAPRATGSAWSPALISDLPAYAQTQFPLDATGIPQGYGLGTSQLSVKAPYRAGYAMTVGSDMPLTAFGVLLDAQGNPVPLQAAKATSPAHPGRSVEIFTNSAGRFAAEGFAPGAWTINLAEFSYAFDIPATPNGLFDAATLMPKGADLPPEETQPPWNALVSIDPE